MSEATMSERPSYSWENRKYLLDTIMGLLDITESDLENDPSWIKAKVRDLKIERVLEK